MKPAQKDRKAKRRAIGKTPEPCGFSNPLAGRAEACYTTRQDMNRPSPSHFLPHPVVPPGETLGETLEIFGLNQTELAQHLGVTRKTITAIIHGKAPLTKEIASQLAKLFGPPAKFWNDLERNYRQGLTRLQEQASQIRASKVS